MNAHNGEVSTPGYDQGLDYPSYLQCAWYIDVGEGVAKLNFDFWDVDYSSSCLQDRLKVCLYFHIHNIHNHWVWFLIVPLVFLLGMS